MSADLPPYYTGLAPFRECFAAGLPILTYHKLGPRPRGGPTGGGGTPPGRPPGKKSPGQKRPGKPVLGGGSTLFPTRTAMERKACATSSSRRAKNPPARRSLGSTPPPIHPLL